MASRARSRPGSGRTAASATPTAGPTPHAFRLRRSAATPARRSGTTPRTTATSCAREAASARSASARSSRFCAQRGALEPGGSRSLPPGSAISARDLEAGAHAEQRGEPFAIGGDLRAVAASARRAAPPTARAACRVELRDVARRAQPRASAAAPSAACACHLLELLQPHARLVRIERAPHLEREVERCARRLQLGRLELLVGGAARDRPQDQRRQALGRQSARCPACRRARGNALRASVSGFSMRLALTTAARAIPSSARLAAGAGSAASRSPPRARHRAAAASSSRAASCSRAPRSIAIGCPMRSATVVLTSLVPRRTEHASQQDQPRTRARMRRCATYSTASRSARRGRPTRR